MPDSKLEIVVSEAPNKAINGILNVYMENFPNLEVLLFNDLLKCGQTNGLGVCQGAFNLLWHRGERQQNCWGVCKLEIVAWGVMKFYFEVGGGLSKVFDYVLN